ncbi:hypothetical protein QYE76_020398 [Lolium multiflorum]|uniref:Mei2-like C-terminal RNA recognition motif domain-containing protein n=1 Tax=Lolium multiflorum TaxID=4521 RepID=A0AAD8R5U8_LOLMU|nr:hypothetical protein QYE76_020398 [Lolium multiflorum]
MAVTKLRADAPPFLISRCHHQFPAPPPPQCMAPSPYHPAACPPPFPVVHNYPFQPLTVPAHPPVYGFPVLAHAPAPVTVPGKVLPPPPSWRKARVAFPCLRTRKVVHSLRPKLPAGTGTFLRKASPSPPPAPLSSKDVPSPPPPTKPAPLRREALPHGTPPHKLMRFLGGGVDAKKLQAKEAAPMAPRAAEPVKPGQEEPAPAPATAPRRRARMATPRSLRGKQASERARGKVVGPRQAKAPVERPCKRSARSPSPAFTTRPSSPMPAPEWRKRQVTTVMIRNIPNKLKPDEMIQLLDEHCARANRKNKPAAYDFLYLPMDFSKCSNMGYAFVNLTTPEAARRLHYALHGARWKVHGTKKIIEICAARIQGKAALVNHFSGSTFPCHTDEYLPAAFSPPRDGAAGTSALPAYVGSRVNIPAPFQPLPVAPAPAPQQHLVWMPVTVGGAGVEAPGS